MEMETPGHLANNDAITARHDSYHTEPVILPTQLCLTVGGETRRSIRLARKLQCGRTFKERCKVREVVRSFP